MNKTVIKEALFIAGVALVTLWSVNNVPGVRDISKQLGIT